MLRNLKDKLSDMKFITSYIWKTEKKFVIFKIPEIILNAAQPFVVVIFPKLIIDCMLYSDSNDKIWTVLKIVLLMTVVNLLIKGGLTLLNTCSTNAFNSFDVNHMVNMGRKIMELEYKYTEQPKILDIFQRTRRTDYCNDLNSSISAIISNTITCIGLIVILSQLKIWVIAIIFAVVILNVLCNRKTQQYSYQWHVDSASYNRIAQYMDHLMNAFQYGKEVRIYNLKDYLCDKYKKFNAEYLGQLFKVTIQFLKYNFTTSSINVIQEGGLYFYLAYKVIVDKLTLGSFTMLLNSIQNLTTCLINISSSVVTISKSSNYINDLRYIMSLECQSSTGTYKIDKDDDLTIEFKDVSFKYPNTDNYVLEHINVKIANRKKVAIVGLNGSGKTTFIKLLLRLYEPTSGVIEVNGVNIKDIEYEAYMKLFASVFQDFQIFAFSMKENILFDKDMDKVLLKEVLEKVKLDENVNELPKQLETMMYKFIDEEGIELSGGQKQKLVIARALYKNTPILILDEPTAALDPLMEYEIYQCINNAIKDKSVLFISHRMSITKFCDDILVFRNGAIIQEGRHEELIKEEDKLYYELYSKQAELYENEVRS